MFDALSLGVVPDFLRPAVLADSLRRMEEMTIVETLDAIVAATEPEPGSAEYIHAVLEAASSDPLNYAPDDEAEADADPNNYDPDSHGPDGEDGDDVPPPDDDGDDDEIDALRQQVELLEGRVEERDSDIASLEQERFDLNAQVASLTEEIYTLRANLRDARENRAETATMFENERGDVDRLTTLLAAYEDWFDDMGIDLAKLPDPAAKPPLDALLALRDRLARLKAI